MRFLKLALTAAGLFVAGAWLVSPAAAQGKPKSQIQSSQARNYTGCYGGLHAGGSIASTELGIGGFALDGLASSGPGGGVHVGCDGHVSGQPFVIGVTADYDWSKVEFSVSPGLFSASIDRSWSVGGRVGVVANGILLYVPVGYTQAEMEWSAGVSAPDLEGIYVGGGFEMPLSDTIFVGAEYRYTRFEDVAVGGVVGLETEQHSLMARLSVRTPDLFASGR